MIILDCFKSQNLRQSDIFSLAYIFQVWVEDAKQARKKYEKYISVINKFWYKGTAFELYLLVWVLFRSSAGFEVVLAHYLTNIFYKKFIIFYLIARCSQTKYKPKVSPNTPICSRRSWINLTVNLQLRRLWKFWMSVLVCLVNWPKISATKRLSSSSETQVPASRLSSIVLLGR